MSKWGIQNIGKLAFVKGGKRLPKGHDYTPEVTTHAYLRVVDFKSNTIDTSNLKYLSNETASKIEKYTISSEDVYISIAGTIGLVGIVPSEYDKSNLTENAAKLVIKDNRIIDKNYTVTYLSSHVGQKQIQSKTIVTTQPKLALFRIEEIEIPVPPIETQKQIAKTLGTAAELLTMRKKQHAELDNLIKSTFYNMFGDPVKNEKGWELVKLGDVGELGSGGTPTRTNPKYFLGDIDWYSAGELNQRYLIESKEKLTLEAIKNSAAKVFKKNSMLIGMYDTAAFKLGILSKDASSNQACANIDINKDIVNIEWLYDCALIMRPFFLENRRGVRQKNLNLGMIRGFEIPLPPLPLQNQFATIVTKIEEQKSIVQKAIDETQYLFDSLMSEYFE